MTHLEALLERRSEPETRAILEDYQHERGEKPMRLGVVIQVDAAADDADAVAADAAAAAADAAAADDAAADDAAGAFLQLQNLFSKDPNMKDGLKIVQVAGAYYGYSVTRVGWLRRVSGDEYELLNARTIARTGSYSLDGINKLASDGPRDKYRLSEGDKGPEEVHRLLIRRSVPASVDAWAKDCPRPKGWQGE